MLSNELLKKRAKCAYMHGPGQNAQNVDYRYYRARPGRLISLLPPVFLIASAKLEERVLRPGFAIRDRHLGLTAHVQEVIYFKLRATGTANGGLPRTEILDGHETHHCRGAFWFYRMTIQYSSAAKLRSWIRAVISMPGINENWGRYFATT